MAVSALGSMTISASAADNINVDIVCKNDTTTVSNAEWSIRKLTLSLPASSAIIL